MEVTLRYSFVVVNSFNLYGVVILTLNSLNCALVLLCISLNCLFA